MKTTAFLSTAAFVVLASAGSSEEATATSSCAAQNIVDSCLATTEGYVALCASQDWGCLCDKYNAIMTCFNNCPSDSRKYDCANSQQLYCMNASLYSTKTAYSSGGGEWKSSEGGYHPKTSSEAPMTTEEPNPAQTSEGPKETKPAGPSAVSAGAAADLAHHGAGALAAVAGIAAALI